ncbi:hypothetical protein Nepgr_032038 [Nepenthes gracilis]|uniref:Serpin domain-containing protein n=1 Tax=Nepenthes gracilis TaxID=150966 RepID=A0AAD3Y7D2_NEPGR|nr:hypothetical protein Nepgr_032038 [Nepenthes gracilis]
MITNFSLTVAKHILLEKLGKGLNAICSPFSIRHILNSLAVGAEGATLKQLLGVLKCRSLNDITKMVSLQFMSSNGGGPTVYFTNGIWISKLFPLKPSYRDFIKTVENAKVEEVDFQKEAVEERINLWAEKATKGLIKNLFPSGTIPKDTISVISNALYFKGDWEIPFDVSRTRAEDFRLLSGQIARASFMNQWDNYYHFGSFEGYKVLKMCYENDTGANSHDTTINGQQERRFSMYVFLPDEKDGLPNLIENIKFQNLFNKQMKLDTVRISLLSIPKFKFSSECELSNIMKKLGLTLPFEHNNELTGMVYGSNFEVTSMFQKSYIETNEEGTEAAAAFGDMLCSASLYNPPLVKFVADHPFMFIIREEFTGCILFMGTIINPPPAID